MAGPCTIACLLTSFTPFPVAVRAAAAPPVLAPSPAATGLALSHGLYGVADASGPITVQCAGAERRRATGQPCRHLILLLRGLPTTARPCRGTPWRRRGLGAMRVRWCGESGVSLQLPNVAVGPACRHAAFCIGVVGVLFRGHLPSLGSSSLSGTRPAPPFLCFVSYALTRGVLDLRDFFGSDGVLRFI